MLLAFDPCGRPMEKLRRGGYAYMQTWQGDTIAPVKVKWYRAAPTSIPYTDWTAFRHSYYGDFTGEYDADCDCCGRAKYDRQVGPHTGVGMQQPYGIDPCGCPIYYPYASNAPPADCYAGQANLGSVEVAREGGRPGIDPAFLTGPGGVCPECLPDPCQVGGGGKGLGGSAVQGNNPALIMGMGGIMKGCGVQGGGYLLTGSGGLGKGGQAVQGHVGYVAGTGGLAKGGTALQGVVQYGEGGIGKGGCLNDAVLVGSGGIGKGGHAQIITPCCEGVELPDLLCATFGGNLAPLGSVLLKLTGLGGYVNVFPVDGGCGHIYTVTFTCEEPFGWRIALVGYTSGVAGGVTVSCEPFLWQASGDGDFTGACTGPYTVEVGPCGPIPPGGCLPTDLPQELRVVTGVFTGGCGAGLTPDKIWWTGTYWVGDATNIPAVLPCSALMPLWIVTCVGDNKTLQFTTSTGTASAMITTTDPPPWDFGMLDLTPTGCCVGSVHVVIDFV